MKSLTSFILISFLISSAGGAEAPSTKKENKLYETVLRHHISSLPQNLTDIAVVVRYAENDYELPSDVISQLSDLSRNIVNLDNSFQVGLILGRIKEIDSTKSLIGLSAEDIEYTYELEYNGNDWSIIQRSFYPSLHDEF